MNKKFATLALLSLGIPAFLAGCPGRPEVECVDADAQGTVNVVGTFRFGGAATSGPAEGGTITGTITFEQDSNIVTVADTVYDFSSDRPVIGQGVLVGNQLQVVLVPKNGDTDYQANVTFIFGPDGRTFCVEFSDTNGDAGGMGSYTGIRG